MKKISYLFIAFSLLLGSLTGCATSTPAPVAATQPALATEAPAVTEAPKASEVPAVTEAAVTEAPTAVSAQEVRYKNTIIFATATDQNFMDGHMNNTNDKVLRTVYSSLIKRTPENEIVGDLADSWESSEDGLTWTFNLKKGVKFHTGKELTSQDVKASYDRLLNKENPVRYTSVMSFISEVIAVDDYTVQLKVETASPIMLAKLTHRANLILDAEYIEKFGAEIGLTVETVNGTGPYKLVTWNKEERMEFEAFADYFGGEPPTKNLIVTVIPEPASRAIAIETGEVDIADGIALEDLARLDAVDGLSVKYFPGIGQHGYQFNCAHPILKDVRLRQAVSYAIDRTTIVNTLYNTAAGEVPSTAPVNPNVWGYHDFGVIQQDQAKAKELMAEAGFSDGFEFSIMVYEGYAKALASTEMIVAQLAEVGISATIEVVDNAGFNSAMGNRTAPGENFTYGMFIMGYGPSSVDADDLRRTWMTSLDGNNNNNYGWYSNPEVDRILTEESTELDPEKRKELLRQVMQILYIDDPAAVWTNDRILAYVMKDTVEGFGVNVVQAIAWGQLAIKE